MGKPYGISRSQGITSRTSLREGKKSSGRLQQRPNQSSIRTMHVSSRYNSLSANDEKQKCSIEREDQGWKRSAKGWAVPEWASPSDSGSRYWHPDWPIVLVLFVLQR